MRFSILQNRMLINFYINVWKLLKSATKTQLYVTPTRPSGCFVRYSFHFQAFSSSPTLDLTEPIITLVISFKFYVCCVKSFVAQIISPAHLPPPLYNYSISLAIAIAVGKFLEKLLVLVSQKSDSLSPTPCSLRLLKLLSSWLKRPNP